MVDSTAERSVGVAVLTFQAATQLDRCLTPIVASSLRPKVLVVDSSSTDDTVAIARRYGAEVRIIPQNDFNHGLTRELARRVLQTSAIVMISQDACLESPQALDRIVEPVLSGLADVSYGRQLPRQNAGFFESFLRSFNFPPDSEVRSISDVARCGVQTFFCSDAFAAYSNATLERVGGFPETLSHEDAIVTARILGAGGRIAYAADARVIHSHPSTLASEFGRYFDAGYARAVYRAVFEPGGRHERVGRQYVFQMLRALKTRPWLLPYAIIHLATKWLAFRIGALATAWGPAVCRRFSGQRHYWSSRPYLERVQLGGMSQ